MRDDMLVELRRLEGTVAGIERAIELVNENDDGAASDWSLDEHGNLSRSVGKSAQ